MTSTPGVPMSSSAPSRPDDGGRQSTTRRRLSRRHATAPAQRNHRHDGRARRNRTHFDCPHYFALSAPRTSVAVARPEFPDAKSTPTDRTRQHEPSREYSDPRLVAATSFAPRRLYQADPQAPRASPALLTHRHHPRRQHAPANGGSGAPAPRSSLPLRRPHRRSGTAIATPPRRGTPTSASPMTASCNRARRASSNTGSWAFALTMSAVIWYAALRQLRVHSVA